MEPTVGEKVKIDNNGKSIYGTITKVYPPCDIHSGRFWVDIHENYQTRTAQFWFNDYGKTVLHEGK